MKISTKDFGLGSTLINFTNEAGVSISFTNLGARVVDWIVGKKNIILGFETAQEYLAKDAYPGATIGRTAGRIKNGQVVINDKIVQLNENEFPQTLHGGEDSFHTKLWCFEIFDQGDVAGVKFYLTSNDGENGYPGKLDVVVTHSFDENSCWAIDYLAKSTKDTVFNPTGHVYFNLNGDASQSVGNHTLKVAASRYVPLLDKSQIVRGDIADVNQTGFDFRAEKRIDDAFNSKTDQIDLVGGLDHPFLLDDVRLDKEQARLALDNLSVSVNTDRPSICIFTANFGDMGTVYRGKPEIHHGGITFETQIAPGSQQIPELGDISLKAGEAYHATTTYTLNF
ncbi:aldose epimerase [Lactococcus fujiensis]|uniref:Aldose 1-epimerase n=1 Tax=Lactococcus fujiensis JCM 16395 TaxID=1291764 RepID=A0A2A5RPN6_9LACT|nr:aldose epimerase [Lactococcus fujiensis]PCS01394.1 aldose 1-epimerase [Lactococcus fujiensis JCM 16395]